MGYSWSDGGWKKSNFARLGGQFVDFALNHSFDSAIFGSWDWNSYESMKSWSKSKILGSWAAGRMQELEDIENERWWEETGKYLGIDPDNLPFPIRSGRYGSTSGSAGGRYASAGFEATQAVMSLYGKWK